MHYATILKHSETDYQPIVLFDHMVGPVRFDSFSSKYKARKYINELTNNDRKMVSLKKLYEIQKQKTVDAYRKMRESDANRT